jgi:hypothetical protein
MELSESNKPWPLRSFTDLGDRIDCANLSS